MRGPYARLTQMRDGSIGFESSYDPGLVAALKAQIPYRDRRWDPGEKIWRVASKHVKTLIALSTQYLCVDAEVQANLFASQAQQPETKLIKLEYLGKAKDRGGDEPSAFGYVDGDWSVLFPLSVLKKWFEFDDELNPVDASTLYAVLGIKRDAGEDDVKKAYRKAAFTWHPDRNNDPDAPQQFIRIKAAYDVLSDPIQRKKYNAGLALAASVGQGQSGIVKDQWGWKPPLRCGYLLVEGILSLGRFNVSKILKWDDIVDARGRVMVTYWPYGNNTFEVRYV